MRRGEGNTTIIVFMESEEYGNEEFEAVDLVDAIQTIKKLYRRAQACFLVDRIARRIGIIIE